MAQMFRMLNYKKPFDGTSDNYNNYLKNMYSYKYTLTMLLDEINVLSKLEISDKESFEERRKFFNYNVVIEVLEDYMIKLSNYIKSLPIKRCKRIPYKTINGKNIFCADIDKKVFLPIREAVNCIRKSNTYHTMYQRLQRFMRVMVKLPHETPKSRMWVDAYKGAGAFYTLKNLIMHHGCVIHTDRNKKMNQSESMAYLNQKLIEYQDDGWRMFALMKKVIVDNNFNFTKRMNEIYG